VDSVENKHDVVECFRADLRVFLFAATAEADAEAVHYFEDGESKHVWVMRELLIQSQDAPNERLDLIMELLL